MQLATVRLRSGFSCILAMVALAATPKAMAQGVFAGGASGVAVTASLIDHEGRTVERVGAHEDVRIVLSFTDALQKTPAANLKPAAWVRRVAPGRPSCANAAWIARATGAISVDDIPLERSYLVSVGSADGSGNHDTLRVIDLDHRLKSADQISVTPLGGHTDDFMVHPALPRAFIAQQATGDILAVDLPWGRASRFAHGLTRPTMIAPLGNHVVVADHGGGGRLIRFDAAGAQLATISIASGIAALARPNNDTIAAAAKDGSAIVIASGDTAPRRLAAGSLNGAVAAGGGVIASAGPRQEVLLRWLDDLDRAVPVPVGIAIDGLFLRDDGRYLVAWSAREPKAVIVDVARSRVAGVVRTNDLVDEAAAAGSAIFLTHRTSPTVIVIDLASLASPEAAIAERRVRLPLVAGENREQSRSRIAVSPATAGMLTVRPGSNVAYAIAAGGGLSDAPMAAIAIRGDQPRMIARFDQRMVETSTGRFEANLRLSKGGAYEVVSTTGAGGTTACAGFSVDGPGADEPPPAALRVVSAPPQAKVSGTLALALDNWPRALPGGLVIRIDDLAFGWSARVAAKPGPDSAMTLPFTFPREGRYAVSVETAGGRIAPAVVDVKP